MRQFFLRFILTFLVHALNYINSNFMRPTLSRMSTAAKSVYDFTVQDIYRKDVSMRDLTANKVTLIVNVASKCGFTPQYEGLEELYKKYKDQGFTILGFPCNQFGGQEPGTEEEVNQFACTKYKTTFPLMKKIEVNGTNAHPLYTHLKTQKGGWFGDNIKWNFTKFLLDKNGNVVERYAPLTSPAAIAKDIEKLLA